MTAIAPDTAIPNPGLIGVRDLLSASAQDATAQSANAQGANAQGTNAQKQIPHRLRRIRNDMVHWLHRFRNDMSQDVRH
jgi:hypothetical protein